MSDCELLEASTLVFLLLCLPCDVQFTASNITEMQCKFLQLNWILFLKRIWLCLFPLSQRCRPAVDSAADDSVADCLCHEGCWVDWWFSEVDTCLSKTELSHHVISQTEQGTEILTQSHDQPKQDSFRKFSSEENEFRIFPLSVPVPPWTWRILCILIWFLEYLLVFLLNNTASFFRWLESDRNSKSCLSQWP